MTVATRNADTIITISKLGRRPTLHINAPPDVKLIHIKSDPDKQFLNRRRKGGKDEI